jgi:hypothetical protein
MVGPRTNVWSVFDGPGLTLVDPGHAVVTGA